MGCAPWGLLPLADDLLNLLAERLPADSERLQGLGGDALTLVDEAKQDVLGTDVVVVEHPGLFLSQNHNPPRPIREPLKHARTALPWLSLSVRTLEDTIHLVCGVE